MSLHQELIIRFPSEHPEEDTAAFRAFFESGFDVGIYPKMADAPDANECKLFIRPKPEGAFVDESLIEMVLARARRWIENRPQGQKLECFSSDEELISTVANS